MCSHQFERWLGILLLDNIDDLLEVQPIEVAVEDD